MIRGVATGVVDTGVAVGVAAASLVVTGRRQTSAGSAQRQRRGPRVLNQPLVLSII